MNDWLSAAAYTVLVLAATSYNQSETCVSAHNIWQFQTKLCCL